MSEETDGAPPPPLPPREAIAAMAVHAPSERNRKLAGLLAAANASDKLKARWHAQQITAQRLGMSDHSWVHLQIVLNSALRIFRLLHRAGVPSAVESDYGMNSSDAEVVIAGACLTHDLGMSIHRVDHESFSLFLAADCSTTCSPTSTRSPSGRSWRPRSCTRSSATAAAGAR